MLARRTCLICLLITCMFASEALAEIAASRPYQFENARSIGWTGHDQDGFICSATRDTDDNVVPNPRPIETLTVFAPQYTVVTLSASVSPEVFDIAVSEPRTKYVDNNGKVQWSCVSRRDGWTYGPFLIYLYYPPTQAVQTVSMSTPPGGGPGSVCVAFTLEGNVTYGSIHEENVDAWARISTAQDVTTDGTGHYRLRTTDDVRVTTTQGLPAKGVAEGRSVLYFSYFAGLTMGGPSGAATLTVAGQISNDFIATVTPNMYNQTSKTVNVQRPYGDNTAGGTFPLIEWSFPRGEYVFPDNERRQVLVNVHLESNITSGWPDVSARVRSDFGTAHLFLAPECPF